MRRIALGAGLLLVAGALAGALRTDGAAAVDPAAGPDTVTVTGTGSVSAVPDRALITAGVESRAPSARAALAANASAMGKVLDALRGKGAEDLTTQTVSLSTGFDRNGQPDGFVATNVASAETTLAGAGTLIDAAVAAGANSIGGPSLSRSDAERLEREALERAVADAKARAALLARAAGRSLGRVTSISEASGGAIPFAARDSAAAGSTPVVSGEQEQTATVSVTYELR